MRFTFHVDGRAREVSADAAGGITVDGVGGMVKVDAPAPDRRTVQVGGKTYEIRVVESCGDTGEFLLELAGERVRVKAADIVRESSPTGRARTWATAHDASAEIPKGSSDAPHLAKAGSVTRAGASASDEVADAGPAPAASAGESKNGVWAPMPGKILRILVKAGQAVKEGDPVLVLEAMKMENELRSPIGGVVKAVHAAEGDQASAGQLLVEFA